MSYIVCSNSTNDNEVLQGIASAGSFQNHFRSPLEVEANSEIAVESVKINRADKFDIVADDQFFVYFGEELTANTLSGSVTTNGVAIDVPVGAYDRNTMATALENAINKAPLNPAINGSAVVSVKSDSNGLFDGFKFSFTSASISDATEYGNGGTDVSRVVEGNGGTIAANLNLADAGTPLKKQFEFTKVGSVLNCCQTRASVFPDYVGKGTRFFSSECCARFQVPPLANACGLCVFDLQSKEAMSGSGTGSWLCGLSRPTTAYSNFGYPYYLTNTAQNSGTKQDRFLKNGTMCDYWVEFSNACKTTGGEDKLLVKQWGKQKDPLQWLPEEVKYYEDGNSQFKGGTPLDAAGIVSNSLRYVIFELCGNELKLYLSQTPTITSGKTFFLVDSAQAAAGANASLNFAPLGNSEEFLHPVVSLTREDQKVALVDYDAFDIANFSFPTTSTFRINKKDNLPRRDNPLIAGSDWWSQAAISSRGQKEIRFNELRPSTLWYGNPDAPTNYRYKNLNSDGTIDYSVVMIVNKENFIDDFNQYKQKLYVIPINQNNANMGRILGFQTFSQIEQSVYGAPTTSASGVAFDSLNAGEFAVSSCFVRVNDLAIQSFNGAKSSMSQMIYHIPRFTNDGKQYGELYFTAPEKTYIKLNNTDKMILNNIKIDIVDRNEVIVDDLQGSTIVALHIRKSTS